MLMTENMKNVKMDDEFIICLRNAIRIMEGRNNE